MTTQEGFTGFPWSDITINSTEGEFQQRVHKIANALIDPAFEAVPVTFERYDLNIVAAEESERDWAVKTAWPISREQFDSFWHPQVEEPEQPQAKTKPEPVPVDALDLFKPKQVEEEDDEEDTGPSAWELRIQRERAELVARLTIVHTVLDNLPNDPFMQRYLNSFGVFDRDKGEREPLGFNFDGIDRNIRFKRDGKADVLFSNRRGENVSSGGKISTHTDVYTSLIDGQEYRSDDDRAAWETALRADLTYLTEQLRQGVPEYFLDKFDEKRGLTSSEDYGTERQLGTRASREFFKGYYQFADAGATLLKATQSTNVFGGIDHEHADPRNSGVNKVSEIYVALKHGMVGRPHLIRLTGIFSQEYEENVTQFRVFDYPHALDGMMTRNRIGGYYGGETDPVRMLDHMPPRMRETMNPAALAMIEQNQPVGTEITQFSHHDFYAVIEFLSKLTLDETKF